MSTRSLIPAEATGTSLALYLSDLVRRAEQNDALAQWELGIRYLKGDTLRRDPQMAAFWLCLAALESDPVCGLRCAVFEGGTPPAGCSLL